MDFILSLLNGLPGSVGQGLMWGIMAIGVYITYRVLDIADLTVDGSLATGGAVCVLLTVSGVNVWLATIIAMLVGMLAGLVTGLFHTKCGIPAILSGILTQLALYSVNLRIMGWGTTAGTPAHPRRQRGQIRPARLLPLRPGAGAEEPDTRCWWSSPPWWWPCSTGSSAPR